MFFIRTTIHFALHFLAPGFVAYIFFREKWKKVWCILIGTMLVDLDHLIASPIFDPERCSIGFHPLHSFVAIGVYVSMLFWNKTRIIAIGLLLHMFTDYLDCLWVY